MRTWKDVATLVKRKNLNGRFVARPAAGLPFVLEEGQEVALVPPQTDLPRSAVVELVRDLGDGSFEVQFDSITDEATASGLVGCHCLVRRSDVQGKLSCAPEASWEGWRVVDESGGLIGEVHGLLDNPGQSLLEVGRGEGLPMAYIPVVDAFICDVREDVRTITVTLPEGLLTLNDD